MEQCERFLIQLLMPGLFGLILLLLLHRPNSKLNQKQQEMAAQALVSSSLTSSVETARQILGSRPLQSPSRKSSSFVVRAASTPPVKQGADRPLWFASKQSLTYLDGIFQVTMGSIHWGLSDPEGTGGFIEPRWLAYGEVINGRMPCWVLLVRLRLRYWEAGPHPTGDRPALVQNRGIPPSGDIQLLGRPLHTVCIRDGTDGICRAQEIPRLGQPGSMGKQYFLGLEKYLGGSGDPAYPGGPLFNLSGLVKMRNPSRI
ncbi:Chlorophyll a-b binding protein 8, chloroplastic [Vitis vinifera]|uniref:Chlorophyll a-b binding protein 8, chloroplastic n=1 Tax=Vitis vinifera TaxID=29760 RepID=A0A438D009_VITVI|nr:Chlorophyll a-b binding protein 8, chloroplastic [Vitis vinifera]